MIGKVFCTSSSLLIAVRTSMALNSSDPTRTFTVMLDSTDCTGRPNLIEGANILNEIIIQQGI